MKMQGLHSCIIEQLSLTPPVHSKQLMEPDLVQQLSSADYENGRRSLLQIEGVGSPELVFVAFIAAGSEERYG